MAGDPLAADAHAKRSEARVQSLLGVIGLVGRDTRLDEFLPDLAGCLRTVAEFDLLGVVLPDDGWKTAHLFAVRLGSKEAATRAREVHSIGVAPLDEKPLDSVGHFVEASRQHADLVVGRRTRAGFEVACARDGQEAWEQIAIAPPDLLVTDLQMPRMDGLELVRRVRANAATRDLPILMLTAKGFEIPTLDIQRDLGVLAVLAKPFSPRELVQRIGAVLGLPAPPEPPTVAASGPRLAAGGRT